MCISALHAWGSTAFSMVLELINPATLARLYPQGASSLFLSIGLAQDPLGHHLHFYVALKQLNSHPHACATSPLPHSIIITSK